MSKFYVSCIQTNSTSDPIINIKKTLFLIKKAMTKKTDLICLPECVGILTDNKKKLDIFFSRKKNIFLDFVIETAKRFNVHIIIGSLPEKKRNGKYLNRSYLIDNKGFIKTSYDKINLFDVKLSNVESYLESSIYDPGNRIKLGSLPWGKVGMSICYDIRFPMLYKKLAEKGALYLSIPAAFTETTGRDHWHSLIRTRAIENGCFVFAPAQCGTHDNGRRTFGHSLIVDPWGRILAEGKNKPAVVYAEIDFSQIKKIRDKIPSMTFYGT